MEEKILSAEKTAEELMEKTKDKDIISDPEKSVKLYNLIHESQEKIEKLYKRWEELEALQTEIDHREK